MNKTLNCIENIDYVGGTKYRCLVHDADIDIDPDFWDDDNAITPVCEAQASIWATKHQANGVYITP